MRPRPLPLREAKTVAEFDMHSFCDRCGAHRLRMPFGTESSFFDRNAGPCGHCGEEGPGTQLVARRARVGRWPWQRAWVDRNGYLVLVGR